jgi:hypothetical protein
VTVYLHLHPDGVDGDPVTTANSDWTDVQPGSGAITYDDDLVLPGTDMAITIAKAAGSTCVVHQGGDSSIATNQITAGFWFRLAAGPSGGCSIIRFRNNGNTSGRADVNLNSTGTTFVVTATGTVIGNPSAAAVPVDEWVLCTVVLQNGNTSTGSIDVRFYDSTLTEITGAAQTHSNQNFSASAIGLVLIGGATSGPSWAPWQLGPVRIETDTLTLPDPDWWLTALEKFLVTVERVSSTSISVGWTDPGDAPDGITIVRAPGAHFSDGNGAQPDDPAYDPLTISGAVVEATGQTTPPYLIEDLAPGLHTVWGARTAPGG